MLIVGGLPVVAPAVVLAADDAPPLEPALAAGGHDASKSFAARCLPGVTHVASSVARCGCRAYPWQRAFCMGMTFFS